MINYRQIGMIVNIQDTEQFEEAFQTLNGEGYLFESDELTGTFLLPGNFDDGLKYEVTMALELESIYVNIQPNIQWD